VALLSAKPLAGRVALVTGGGRGIGPAMCVGLALAGASVAVNYRTSRAGAEEVCHDIRQSGGTARAFQADVASAAAIETMFDAVEAELGRVDVLVNNAGIYPQTPWHALDRGGLGPGVRHERQGHVLLRPTGCERDGRAAVGQDHQSGPVTHFTGGGGSGGYAHYIATKGAAIGLTRALARELGGSGITVNAIAPGAILTQTEIDEYPDAEGLKRFVLDRQSLKRRLLPEDLVGTVVVLASEGAAAVTGQTLLVDGGWAMG
jgi:3-oxoacyl-[acyl-carrier protein] reductase